MKKSLPVILLLLGGLALVFGFAWMLEVRLERGDSYPAYSSLRSDPLGTMALYESFARLPGLTVSRDYQYTDELPDQSGTVYLQLGGESWDWDRIPNQLYDNLKAFLGHGGRLVVILKPSLATGMSFDKQKFDDKQAANKKADSKDAKDSKNNPPKKNNDPGDDNNNDDQNTLKDTTDIKDKWGLNFDWLDITTDDHTVPVNNTSGLALPKQLDWHSTLIFTKLDPAWKAIYSRNHDPVFIERAFGPGSVVMATDSYFLSNEALRKDRHADLLAWLVGSGHNVVFDESHFGIVEMPGIAALIRRYHLTGLVGIFILLAVLFIWKNMTSLVPAQEVEANDGYVEGLASSAGFVNLLRRSIAPRELLATCLAEWKKSLAALRPGAKLAEAQAVLAAEQAKSGRQRSSVQAYTEIVQLLKKPTFTAVAPEAPAKPPILTS